jgi:hypothetical protein
VTLDDLLKCEGDLRNDFERFIYSLEAVKYSIDRYGHGEYKNPAVYYMWTGFCMANLTFKDT